MTPEDRDRHIRAIIEREGGWVDDPDDSGGPTNYGITLAMWQGHLWSVHGRMGAGDKRSLRELTPDGAMRFYRWYFDAQGLDELIDEFDIPDELVPLVMDMRTLHSPGGCRKILRRALGRNGYSSYEQWAGDEGPEAAGDAIALFRMRYMLEVAADRREKKKYVEGWMRRALKAIGLWPPQDLPEVKEV